MTHPRSSAAAEGSEGSAVESPEQGLSIDTRLGADRLRAVEGLVEQPVVEPAREERTNCARSFFEASEEDARLAAAHARTVQAEEQCLELQLVHVVDAQLHELAHRIQLRQRRGEVVEVLLKKVELCSVLAVRVPRHRCQRGGTARVDQAQPHIVLQRSSKGAA